MRELLGSVMIIASFAFLGWEQKEKLRRRAVTLAVLGQALERTRGSPNISSPTAYCLLRPLL